MRNFSCRAGLIAALLTILVSSPSYARSIRYECKATDGDYRFLVSIDLAAKKVWYPERVARISGMKVTKDIVEWYMSTHEDFYFGKVFHTCDRKAWICFVDSGKEGQTTRFQCARR